MLQFRREKFTYQGLFLLVLVFFITRAVQLDRDLPPYEKTMFGSKDEQAYNSTAINLYHFGKTTKEIGHGYYIRGGFRGRIETFFNNLITYLSLSVFGNNYYGLRGGAVFSSLIILMLFIKLMLPILLQLGKTTFKWVIIFLAFMILFDFGFLVTGRNASPIIFRSMYIILIVFYLTYTLGLKGKAKYLHFFLIGALSSFLIFFSYITNAFIFAGVIITFILKWVQDYDLKKMGGSLLAASTGFLISTAISDFVYQHYFKYGIYKSITSTFDTFSGDLSIPLTTDMSMSIVTFIKSGIINTLSLFSSNLFSLNFIFLFITLASSLLTIYLLIRRCSLKNIHTVSFSMFIVFTIQAFFYFPHASKSIIVIYPILLLFITSSLSSAIKHKTLLLDFCIKKSRIIHMLAGCILTFIVLLFIFSIYKNQSALQYGFNLDTELAILFSFSLLLFLIFLFSIITSIKNLNITLKPIIPILILMSLIPNIYLSLKYCLLQPQFHYREALITLNDAVKDKVVAGSWSDGFRLYTQGNTIFPWNENIHNLEEYRRGLSEIFELGIADYTVDYTDKDFIDVFKDIDTIGKGFKLEIDTTLYLGTGAYRDSLIVIRRIPK